MANHSFNLVTEPWIPVLADGKHESYSLETLFDQPTSIRQLDIADPLERVSIMRLLLAIMYAARQEGYSSPAGAKRIMEAGRDQEIIDYLHAWAHRFDLMSETEPFLQVAGMMPQGKPKDYGFTRLHPAMQRPLWQTHDPYKPVTPAEAARMLLVCNMYDVAGLHTGMNGDSKAAEGKRTPQGVAQAGGLAIAIIDGNNLWETLVLNFCPTNNGNKPIWEYPPLECADMEPDATVPPNPTALEHGRPMHRRLRHLREPFRMDDPGKRIHGLLDSGQDRQTQTGEPHVRPADRPTIMDAMG